MTYELLLDVGGTEIKWNIGQINGQMLLTNNQHLPAHANENQATILAQFKTIFKAAMLQTNQQIQQVALAFPGPFDYQKGISYMQNLNKYDAIYGFDLRQFIEAWFQQQGVKLERVLFINDANAFSLGAYRQFNQTGKAVCITLGTGCGSTLIDNGVIVKSGFGLNPAGMFYDTPFQEGVIDQYLSLQGLIKLAQKYQLPFENGKALALAAKAGNATAQQIFEDFGQWLKMGVTPFLHRFQADTLIIGGQISQSYALFSKPLEMLDIEIKIAPDTTTATLNGLYHLLLEAKS